MYILYACIVKSLQINDECEFKPIKTWMNVNKCE